MTPVYKSDQVITFLIGLQNEEEFFCSYIYASNGAEERKVLWGDLCDHHSSPMFRNKAWLLMGDFNEILEGEESTGFARLLRPPSGMRDFQRMVLNCNLSDMGYQGPLHTWCNKREEGVICKKLDRVLMNNAALNRFPNGFAKFEPRGCSDHLRCKIQLLPPSNKTAIQVCECYWESTELHPYVKGILGIYGGVISLNFSYVQILQETQKPQTTYKRIGKREARESYIESQGSLWSLM